MKLRFFDIDAKCKPTRSVLPVRIFGNRAMKVGHQSV